MQPLSLRKMMFFKIIVLSLRNPMIAMLTGIMIIKIVGGEQQKQRVETKLAVRY